MAEDYFNMQQDALRRAREMYSRGRPQNISNTRKSEAVKENVKEEKSSEPAPVMQVKENLRNNKNQNRNLNQNTKSGDILELLLKDQDKTIILALLILLSSEKTDTCLLFALIFLLM